MYNSKTFITRIIQYGCENGELSRWMLCLAKLNCYFLESECRQLSLFIGLFKTAVKYQGSA